jgi:hypothetical protein
MARAYGRETFRAAYLEARHIIMRWAETDPYDHAQN